MRFWVQSVHPKKDDAMMEIRNIIKCSLGVPLAKPRVALSAASPRSFLAVGFPLQSLTQNWFILIVVAVLSATTLKANTRFDTLRTTFSTCHTQVEFDGALNRTFTEFEIKFRGEMFSRQLDFGYKQAAYQLILFYGNSSVEEYRVYLILDSANAIALGTLQRLDVIDHDRIIESDQFKPNPKWLEEYTSQHRVLYDSQIDQQDIFQQLTELIVFGFGCGFGGGYDPPIAQKMKDHVDAVDIKSLSSWLRQASPELQAYGATGLLQLQSKGITIPADDVAFIDHLKQRDTPVHSCSGCIVGMMTPLSLLLTQKMYREP